MIQSPDLRIGSEPVRVWTDVDYLEQGRTEKLDLFYPAGPPPESGFPAVVLIHGGGFGGGARSRPGNVANSLRLAQAGIVVANIDYRLATRQKRSWPVALHDCKNAVRHLRVHADRYRIDPGRISVVGFSAGGQLALLVGLTAGNDELAPERPYPGVSDEVRSVVNFFGGTNFLTRRVVGPDGEPTAEPYYATAQGLLGSQSPDRDPERWAQASPVTHVHAGAPPVLTIHGKRDKGVDYHQAIELATALDRVGAPNRLIMPPDLGHGFGTLSIPDELFSEVLRFLAK